MAQSPLEGPFDYTDTFELTASDTSQAFSSDYYANVPLGGGTEIARTALIQVLDAGISWRIGGTADPATETYLAPEGSIINLVGKSAITGFRFINSVVATNARLVVTMGF